MPLHVTDPIFGDALRAREFLEAERWRDGVLCPHCGNRELNRIVRMEGKAHRDGLYNCRACRKQFSVTVGTVLEGSKVPLNKWLLAVFLVAGSSRGSTRQLQSTLGVTYKTAWLLLRRIRSATACDEDEG